MMSLKTSSNAQLLRTAIPPDSYITRAMSTSSKRRPVNPPPIVLPSRYRPHHVSISQKTQTLLPDRKVDTILRPIRTDVEHYRRQLCRGSYSTMRACTTLKESNEQPFRPSDFMPCSVDPTRESLLLQSVDLEAVVHDDSPLCSSHESSPMPSMYSCDTALESTLGPVPILLHKGLSRAASARQVAPSVDAFFWTCDSSTIERRAASRISAASAFSTTQLGHMPVSPTATATTGRSLRSIRTSMGAMNAKAFAAHAADLLQNATYRSSASSPTSSEGPSLESSVSYVASLPVKGTPRSSPDRQRRARSGSYSTVSTEDAGEQEAQRPGWRRRSTTLAALLNSRGLVSFRESEEQKLLGEAGWYSSPATTTRTLESSLSFVTASSTQDSTIPMCRVNTLRSNLTGSPLPRGVTSCRSPLLLSHLGDLKQDGSSLGVRLSSPLGQSTCPTIASTPSSETITASKSEKQAPPSSNSFTKCASTPRKFSSLNDLRGAVFPSKASRTKQVRKQSQPPMSPINDKAPSAKEARRVTLRIDNCLGIADFDWENEWEPREIEVEEPGYAVIDTRGLLTAQTALLSPPTPSASSSCRSSWRKCPGFVSIDSAILGVFPQPPEFQNDQRLGTALQEDTSSPVSTASHSSLHAAPQYSPPDERGGEGQQAKVSTPLKPLPALPPVSFDRHESPSGPQELSSRFSTITSCNDSFSHRARSSSIGSTLAIPFTPSSKDLRQKFAEFGMSWQPSRSIMQAVSPSPASALGSGEDSQDSLPLADGKAEIEGRKSHGNALGESVIQSSIRRAKSFRSGRALFARVLNSNTGSHDDMEKTATAKARTSMHHHWRNGDYSDGASKLNHAKEPIKECDETPFVYCPTPSGTLDRGASLQGTLRSVMSKRSLLPAGLGSRFS